MVSKKKAKGRARKIAQDAKAEEKNELEAQMQRLTIDDLLREENVEQEEAVVEAQSQQTIFGSLKQCGHGFDDFGERPEETCRILDFIKEFVKGYNIGKIKSGGEYKNAIVSTDMIVSWFYAGIDATAECFADILEDAAMLRKVSSCCVATGTSHFANKEEEEETTACAFSFVAYFFEQYIEVAFKKSQPRGKWHELMELHYADEHTFVSFLRRRIPCKCLDKKYTEVKSIIKMGVCANPSCSLTGRNAPRASMLSCAGCYSLCYCSIECQKAHWPDHKVDCAEIANLATNFDATHHGVVCGYVNQSGKLCIFGFKH